MTHKRTKKDVEDAYRRGFEAGFNVRPNPLTMVVRALWKRHELKRLKKAYQEELKKGGKHHPVWGHDYADSIEIIVRDDSSK